MQKKATRGASYAEDLARTFFFAVFFRFMKEEYTLLE